MRQIDNQAAAHFREFVYSQVAQDPVDSYHVGSESHIVPQPNGVGFTSHASPLSPKRIRLAKSFGSRGPLQLHKLALTTAFMCYRFELPKNSHFVAFESEQTSRPICNGCYARLLASTSPHVGT